MEYSPTFAKNGRKNSWHNFVCWTLGKYEKLSNPQADGQPDRRTLKTCCSPGSRLVVGTSDSNYASIILGSLYSINLDHIITQWFPIRILHPYRVGRIVMLVLCCSTFAQPISEDNRTAIFKSRFKDERNTRFGCLTSTRVQVQMLANDAACRVDITPARHHSIRLPPFYINTDALFVNELTY